jgi:hypothetical protein
MWNEFMSLRTQPNDDFYEYGIDVPGLKMAEKFLTTSTTISYSKRRYRAGSFTGSALDLHSISNLFESRTGHRES